MDHARTCSPVDVSNNSRTVVVCTFPGQLVRRKGGAFRAFNRILTLTCNRRAYLPIPPL